MNCSACHYPVIQLAVTNENEKVAPCNMPVQRRAISFGIALRHTQMICTKE